MDVILYLVDNYLGVDSIYGTIFPVNGTSSVFDFMTKEGSDHTSSLARDNIYRQTISLFFITWVFGALTYFIFSSLSYYFIFDKRVLKHPKFLKNQIRLEISQTLQALPLMAVLTTPWFLWEVRGYSKLYDNVSEHGWLYLILQFPLFLIFTDYCIYLIHRGLHSKLLYTRLHKVHHKWIMPTPFASHAFHPVDGFVQSLPYHVFPFIFPLHKYAYIALFTFINIWTVLIHDGEYLANNPIINGAACHSLHHMKFMCNYGQFTTLFDRMGGSYMAPDAELYDKELNRGMWEKQSKDIDEIRKQIGEIDEKDSVAKLIEKESFAHKKEK